MKALILTAFNTPYQLQEITKPIAGKGEVLVKIMASGIQGSRSARILRTSITVNATKAMTETSMVTSATRMDWNTWISMMFPTVA